MPRVHFVKKARKDNPICKAGESYYWWKFRYGGKRYSLTPPKQSQLTQSEFLSTVWSIEENIDTNISTDDLEDAQAEFESLIEDLTSEIRQAGEECLERRDSMPESLQDGEIGELLQGRYDTCEEWAANLEGIDLKPDEDEDCDDYIDRILGEITQYTYEGE